MESIDESGVIWQSVDNIVAMRRSLEALRIAFEEEMEVIGKGVGLSFAEDRRKSSPAVHDHAMAFGHTWGYKLEASDGDASVLKGMVAVRVELWRKAGDAAAWPDAKTPLVYVAFHGHDAQSDSDVDYYRGFGLDQYGKPYHDAEDGSAYCARTPLWIWDEIPKDVDRWIESSWFFAIPLVALGSHNDLCKEIAEPLRALLIENRAPEEVFRGKRALPAVAPTGQ